MWVAESVASRSRVESRRDPISGMMGARAMIATTGELSLVTFNSGHVCQNRRLSDRFRAHWIKGQIHTGLQNGLGETRHDVAG